MPPLQGNCERQTIPANVQYAIRTEGDFEHQYANDLIWIGGPGMYVVLTDEFTLSLQAIVSGETKGKDTFSGVRDEDSAETLVYLGPQVNFTWGSRFSATAAVDLPVSRNNSHPGHARLSRSGGGELSVFMITALTRPRHRQLPVAFRPGATWS